MIDESQYELVKEEFSRAKDYASEYQIKTPIGHFFNIRLQRVSEMLESFKRGDVLDIGCGPGVVCKTFRGRPIKYYGVDISEDMIRECMNTFGHEKQFLFSIGKMEELPFPDSCFDVVLCLGVFEYVLDSRIAMNEISRVIKPNGIFIVTMLNQRSPYRIWQRFVYWKIKNGIDKIKRLNIGEQNICGTIHSKPIVYNESNFRRLMTSHGMEIEDIVYYDFNVFLNPFDKLFPRISVFISRKLEFLCRSYLKFLGTGFMLKCRRN